LFSFPASIHNVTKYEQQGGLEEVILYFYSIQMIEYRIQAVLGRLREILFLDWDIGLLQYLPAVHRTLLASNYVFWFGLRFVGIHQIFYS
jgi:hypothetical protein